MNDEEVELIENFRELSPENQRIALANIRLANVTETAARKAYLNGHYPEHRDRNPAPMGAARAAEVV
jgi:hypothetical protein